MTKQTGTETQIDGCASGLARVRAHARALARRFPWPWRQEGRHYKLMLGTAVAVLIAIPILWMVHAFLAGAVLFLWLLTLAVQWLCIEPPGVEEKDLH